MNNDVLHAVDKAEAGVLRRLIDWEDDDSLVKYGHITRHVSNFSKEHQREINSQNKKTMRSFLDKKYKGRRSKGLC